MISNSRRDGTTWHYFFHFFLATAEAGINLENDGRCLIVRSGVRFFFCDFLMGKHVETLHAQVRDQDPDACPIRNRGGEVEFSDNASDSNQT